jgi:tetratricopeptide (TPR) repeat protein
MLTRAGDRAASLAAREEALRYFARAAEMADDDADRAALHERAGENANAASRFDQATEHFQAAIGLFESLGLGHAAARVSARLGDTDMNRGRTEEAVERMQAAYDVLASDPPDEDLARLAAQLARIRFLRGEMAEVAPMAEVALDIAEKHWLPEILSEAMNTKAVVAIWLEHPEEAFALLNHALRIALENDVPAAALRAYGNLGETLSRRDRYEESLETYREAIALARRAGHRPWETFLEMEQSFVLMRVGGWDEALEIAERIWVRAPELAPKTADTLLSSLPEIHAARGEVDEVAALVERYTPAVSVDDVQGQGMVRWAAGVLAQLRGDHGEALEKATLAMESRTTLGMGFQGVKQGFVLAGEAALALGDMERLEGLLGMLDALPPAQVTPFYQANRDRFRALLAARRGEGGAVDGRFKASIGMFRELGMRPRVAMTEAEYGQWLAESGRADEVRPLLSHARETFEALRAEPWLERVVRAEQSLGLAAASS